MTDFKVVKPNNNLQQEADAIYSKTFMRLWETGEAPPRIKVEQLLKQQGLLDMEAVNFKSDQMRKSLRDLEIKLRKGKNPDGTKMSKHDGRDIALSMRKVRDEIADLTSGVSSYFNTTAESLASLEKIMFLVYSCTKKLDGSPYWPTFEDYKSDANSDSATQAMQELLKVLAGTKIDFERQLYENSWLIKQGFMNEKYQLIDSKGRLVTEEGRLTDPEGNYINEQGQRIDYFGNLLNDEGELLIEDGWSDEVAVPTAPSVPLTSQE